MATNPMQRKARNSFLLGMLTMLLVAALVIGLLVMMLMNEKKKAEADPKVNVYALNSDVSSGQVITQDMLSLIKVNKSMVPNNATSDISLIQNYALQDKEGDNIYTKYKDNQPSLYVKKDKEYEVKKEETTDNYYITKNNDEKQYLELNSVPLIAKVSMKTNTVLTTELLSKSDNIVQDDVRKQEYNVLILPMDLVTGDYIDIRVMFPNGQDFIVVSKKEVEIPSIGGVDSSDTLWVNLSEDEILHMSCAIVDAAQVKGSKLYATKYTEAGMQKAATPTYPVNASTSQLLLADSNVLSEAMTKIRERYGNQSSAAMRNDYIQNEINKQGEQAQSNLETALEKSATDAKSSRKSYLDSLSGTN